jgi:hypothetical protein
MKPKLPNKPISKASVYFAGERNAGISSTYMSRKTPAFKEIMIFLLIFILFCCLIAIVIKK